MTRDTYLTVTFRHGKSVAGYLHFPCDKHELAAKTKEMRPGLVVDFAADGQPIGLENISPATVTLEEVNEVLLSLNKEEMAEEELAPLKVR